MTEYAEKSFDVEEYLSKRPRYPKRVYDRILEYHREGEKYRNLEKNDERILLDLGCGPGQGGWPLFDSFDQIIGIDPGEGMIVHARQAFEQIVKTNQKQGKHCPKADYQVCSIENLSTLSIKPNSIQMVISATAAHWFDMEKCYSNLKSKVQKGGTIALFTYDLAYPMDHLSTSEMVSRFAYEDMTKYVDLEGCKRIRSLYVELDRPEEQDWTDVEYFAYPNKGKAGGYVPILPPKSVDQLPHQSDIQWDWDLRTEGTTSWDDLAAAKRTNGSYFNWRKENPEIPFKDDIAAKQVNALRDQVLQDRQQGIGNKGGQNDQSINVMRPMGLLLMRKS